jgi:tetratricopeptide (TPR) repeat protein
MKQLLSIFFACISLLAQAQGTLQQTSDYAAFYRAEALYEKEQFGAAREEFRNFIKSFSNTNDPLYIKARYYEGIAALELYNNDAQAIIEDFNKDYPESIYKYEIYHRLGRFYYQKKDWHSTIVWLSRVDPRNLDEIYRDEYYFKKGYAHFMERQYPESKSNFFEIKDGTSQYAAPATYYYSHLAYMDGNFQTALVGFEKLLGDDRFKAAVPYYVANIYYQQKKYDEVIRFGGTIMDSVSDADKPGLNRIVGDSYYRLGKYDEAVPYLENFNVKSESSRYDDYQLGYSYYKIAEYSKAIKYFDKTGRIKDSLAHVSSYHIADCYQKMDSLGFARNAFEVASKMEFDKVIQEDAMYNYAILSYKLDLNPYDEAEVTMNKFLEKYPNSKRRDDIFHYLINVYTSTNNYEDALKNLEKIPNKDAKLKTAYQLVAFNYGIESYQKSDYKKSIANFVLVEKYPMDQELSAKAMYWTADANYQLKEYAKAGTNYKKFLMLPSVNPTLRQDAYYNLGYTYFNQKENTLASENFRTYTQQSNISNKKKLADAYMRIGDIAYLASQNDAAIENYKKALALKSGQEDQSLYFMAKTSGYLGKTDDKIKYLSDIINNYKNSRYMLVSIYETGLAYRFKQEDGKAQRYFEQIIKDHPTHILVKDALLELATIQSKQKEYSNAEGNFRKVLTNYNAEGNDCEVAVNGILEIYRAKKELDKIDVLKNEYPCGNISDDDQEDAYYEAAMQVYKNKEYTQAIVEFQKYLTKFEIGRRKTEVKSKIANCYWELKEEPKAIAIYNEILGGPNSDYTEIAASRVAKTYYNNKQYTEALPAYERLEKVSITPDVLNNTQIGIMRCHALLENWETAGAYAQKVLLQSNLLATVKVEAKYVSGKNDYFQKRYAECKSEFDFVIKNSTSVFAAESRYLTAEMYYRQNDYSKSDIEIRALLKMKPTYNFWVAKGLILQTRNLMAKNDLVQAEYTLASVKENYTDQEDGIMDEANELWEELMQLKNKPKSLKAPTGTEVEIDKN